VQIILCQSEGNITQVQFQVSITQTIAMMLLILLIQGSDIFLLRAFSVNFLQACFKLVLRVSSYVHHLTELQAPLLSSANAFEGHNTDNSWTVIGINT
jgi:hypothetical protein